ncbi:MAG: GIY-YIG nuclease family protein [Ignavibacteria bacterium]|nr:GIY-YIG nuclease family protein [Ignavibacteria bacterium]
MKKFYTYVIKSTIDGRLYKGVTDNIKRRLTEHNAGKTKSTKAYIPWKLVQIEEFDTFEAARKRELYLKSGEGREFLKKIID